MIQISLFFAVAGLNNKIYAMGREFTYQDITSRLEIVDPISGVGTAKAPMIQQGQCVQQVQQMVKYLRIQK
jgi:hypothetical protein